MEFFDTVRSYVLGLPDLAKFAIVIAVIVGIPPLARRVRIPDIVGLLLFGVILRPMLMERFAPGMLHTRGSPNRFGRSPRRIVALGSERRAADG